MVITTNVWSRAGYLFRLPDPLLARSWFLWACEDIAIGDKPAAGLSPKIGDKRLSSRAINVYRQ